MAYARHSSNNRRTRTNNRGGNNNRNGGNNRRPQARLNHVYDSNGPEGRVRGTAAQIIEKYTTLANDASASGDKVLQQSLLQHAEHYQRILNEIQREIDQQNERRAEQNNQKDDSGNSNDSNNDDNKTSSKGKKSETDNGKMTDVPGFLAGDDASQATKKETKTRAPRKPKTQKIEVKSKADVLETEPA